MLLPDCACGLREICRTDSVLGVFGRLKGELVEEIGLPDVGAELTVHERVAEPGLSLFFFLPRPSQLSLML